MMARLIFYFLFLTEIAVRKELVLAYALILMTKFKPYTYASNGCGSPASMSRISPSNTLSLFWWKEIPA
jgi:hypothetical protein